MLHTTVRVRLAEAQKYRLLLDAAVDADVALSGPSAPPLSSSLAAPPAGPLHSRPASAPLTLEAIRKYRDRRANDAANADDASSPLKHIPVLTSYAQSLPKAPGLPATLSLRSTKLETRAMLLDDELKEWHERRAEQENTFAAAERIHSERIATLRQRVDDMRHADQSVDKDALSDVHERCEDARVARKEARETAHREANTYRYRVRQNAWNQETLHERPATAAAHSSKPFQYPMDRRRENLNRLREETRGLTAAEKRTYDDRAYLSKLDAHHLREVLAMRTEALVTMEREERRFRSLEEAAMLGRLVFLDELHILQRDENRTRVGLQVTRDVEMSQFDGAFHAASLASIDAAVSTQARAGSSGMVVAVAARGGSAADVELQEQGREMLREQSKALDGVFRQKHQRLWSRQQDLRRDLVTFRDDLGRREDELSAMQAQLRRQQAEDTRDDVVRASTIALEQRIEIRELQRAAVSRDLRRTAITIHELD
jgi:hypothetical protein